MTTKERPLIAISACLLGKPVRYNGGSTNDRWIIQELSKHVDFYPFCPELEMGLGVPREEIHLVYTKEKEIKLLGKKSKNDYSAKAYEADLKIIQDFKSKGIDGVILMRKSPSCGPALVKTVALEQEGPVLFKAGHFAYELQKQIGTIPTIDSGKIKNQEWREHFLKNVFAHFRFNHLESKISKLQEFHQKYKYLLMEQNQTALRALGQIVANSKRAPFEEVKKEYWQLFFSTMICLPQTKNRVNALMHVFGHIKHYLSSDQKRYWLETLEKYSQGPLPYLVPRHLLSFLGQNFKVDYITSSYYFCPIPDRIKIGA